LVLIATRVFSALVWFAGLVQGVFYFFE
jgi:hypothetical protein